MKVGVRRAVAIIGASINKILSLTLWLIVLFYRNVPRRSSSGLLHTYQFSYAFVDPKIFATDLMAWICDSSNSSESCMQVEHNSINWAAQCRASNPFQLSSPNEMIYLRILQQVAASRNEAGTTVIENSYCRASVEVLWLLERWLNFMTSWSLSTD